MYPEHIKIGPCSPSVASVPVGLRYMHLIQMLSAAGHFVHVHYACLWSSPSDHRFAGYYIHPVTLRVHFQYLIHVVIPYL